MNSCGMDKQAPRAEDRKLAHPEVTCVVPTHNRPHFLRRWFRFYREFPPGFSVLVVDSSNPAAALENRALVAAQRGILTAEYLHAETDFYSKLVLALAQVTTPFVTLCADDDLALPEAIRQSAGFLAREPSYATALGRTVKVYPQRRWFACQRLKGYSIEQANPLDRCRQLAGNFFTTFYGVYRTETLHHNLTLVASNSDTGSTYAVAENLLSQLSVIPGRVKLLSCPHLLLERHPAMAGVLVRGRWENVVPLFQRFRSCLVNELVNAGVGQAEAEDHVDRSYAHFADPDRPGLWRKRPVTEKMTHLANSLWERLEDGWQADRVRHRRPLLQSDIAGSEPIWDAAVALMRRFPDGMPADAESGPFAESRPPNPT